GGGLSEALKTARSLGSLHFGGVTQDRLVGAVEARGARGGIVGILRRDACVGRVRWRRAAVAGVGETDRSARAAREARERGKGGRSAGIVGAFEREAAILHAAAEELGDGAAETSPRLRTGEVAGAG